MKTVTFTTEGINLTAYEDINESGYPVYIVSMIGAKYEGFKIVQSHPQDHLEVHHVAPAIAMADFCKKVELLTDYLM